MKAAQFPICLDPAETVKVMLRLEVHGFFAECPRLMVRTVSAAQILKLPISLLRICHPPSHDSPAETLAALSPYALSDDFHGWNPAFTKMPHIVEAISFSDHFQSYTYTKVPALGKTGIMICGVCLGQDIVCKVVLRPDATGGTITCLASNALLRKELLSHLKSTLSPARNP